MGLITGAVAFIGGALGLAGTALTVFTAIGTTVLSLAASSLLSKRMGQGKSGGSGGGRVQLPPATDNKLPVIYGSAFTGGPVVDAYISQDLRFMWYVIAIAEVTDTTPGSSYTFGSGSLSTPTNIYYDGKEVQFGFGGRVTGLINNTPGQTEIDTKVDGKIFIYLFPNGNGVGQNTGGLTATQIMSDSRIPPSERWNAVGKNNAFTNTAFVIARVEYDDKAGTRNLGALMCKITNNLDKPGNVIKDYMLNTRYGCAIPLARIDTDSLDLLNDYSDEIITYTGGTQERYRINGPIATSTNCLDNLQYLVDSCDSWLQYSELTARWKVVINQSYTDYTTIDDLFLVDGSNQIGGINISPINLNDTFNELEVSYPNKYIKDQIDYQVIELDDYAPQVISPNEALNRLNLNLPLVNNSVQALYLGIRRLLQSREDLTVTFKLDYSGIQIDAGDVIRIKHEEYGWDVLNSGKGKLFRVASVAEEKYPDGNLGVSIAALEYNNTIYADQAIIDFQPDPNTGLTDPNIISNPGTPNVALNPDGAGVVSSFNVESWVPDVGAVLYMDFNYGNTSNTAQHILYRTISSATGTKFDNSNSNANIFTYLSVDINDLPAGNYYFSTVARNDFGGANSNSSTLFFWPGAGINEANIIDANGVFSSGNILTSNNAIANLSVGANVFFLSGTGQLANNTFITVVNSTTPTANFEVSPTPVVALANATIQVIIGGINGNAIVPNTMPGNRVTPNTLSGNTLIGNTVNGNVLINGTVNGNVLINGTVNGNVIIANTLHGNTIIANTVSGNTIIANTLSGNTIIANTLNGNTITANTVNGNTIIANTLNGNTILANTVNGNAITANTLNGNTIIANTINGNTFIANTLNGNSIIANTLNGNTITVNTLNGNTILANTLNGNSIIANTINGNSIIANTINGNSIIANTINGNSIIANTINGNTIIANTIDGNTIIGNTMNGNVIIANTLNGNSIQAFSINGGVAFVAGTIQAQAIAANTITFENLAIGSVTQSRSTLSDPIIKPIPFTNVPNTWPNNTRCVIPAGGVTIIPSTDPQSSANTEYTEGSRIQVSYSVKMYVDPGNVANTSQNWDQYNLVEIWKSGASSVFDRGFNTVRQVYDLTGNATSASNQQLQALGYAPGGIDLYSDDGGNSWQTYNANGTERTISSAFSWAGTTFTSYPRNIDSAIFGPYQTKEGNFSLSELPYCGTGLRFNAGAGLGDKLYWTSGSTSNTSGALAYRTSANSAIAYQYQNDFLSCEMTPDTGGNGYPYITSGSGNNVAGYILTGTNGDIFYENNAIPPQNLGVQPVLAKESVPNLLKDLNASYSNPANANTYTAVIVGQTGTILRSERAMNASDFASSWTPKSIYIQGNISQPVLTDLYAVAGDNTINNPATSEWVAVGQYGMIQYSSDDGDAWDQVYLGNSVSCDFNGIRYGNGKWVAVGDGGNIYVTANAANANSWTQLDTGNLLYTNGSSYGSIYGVYGNGNVNTNTRQLNTVNYNGEWDTWSIGGQGMILYSDDNANTFKVAYEQTASESYDLQRVTFFGSWPNVANVSRPPAEQRILNNQIFSGTILDTSYVAGQETTYYLVIGNMNGNTILAGQIFLQVQEIKR